MEVIKKEPELDPLAIESSDKTDEDEKKPLSQKENFLDLHVARIKTECVDHSYDLTLKTKVEKTAVATDFVSAKCKAEEELCDLDTVKDELKLEITTEENEILSNSEIVAVLRSNLQHEEPASTSQGDDGCHP
ncbi:uncharacterized protein [Periplaneta americana]|uniref:uncharacterized protein isoform X4 n=1 Tax=Periplaneta americana TaxID=6978 RepID=UPI0037E8662A